MEKTQKKFFLLHRVVPSKSPFYVAFYKGRFLLKNAQKWIKMIKKRKKRFKIERK